MADIPTAEELEALFQEGKLERIGMGSRRACYRLPHGGLCVKCYRSDEEIREGKYGGDRKLSASVVREIKRHRFDRVRNTSCQEYRYLTGLVRSAPEDVIAYFPSYMHELNINARGWCLVEELICNADGSAADLFADEYRRADVVTKRGLLASFGEMTQKFIDNAVRFYDPQNVLVQWIGDGSFRLRIADFEPMSRTLIPLDFYCPALVRMKVRRRVRRALLQLGIYSEEKTDV